MMSEIPFSEEFLQSRLTTLNELNRLSVSVKNLSSQEEYEHLSLALDSVYASFGQLIDTLLQHKRNRIYTSDAESYIKEQLNYSASQLNTYCDKIETPE
ncbi:hypothetical protein [Alkalicoccobacillus gibsonii]|uniref:hypothetical protein n=1 Tax=Alkalicoccobacillus gibsonii TaxID=79881 RepID=UPI00193204E1|nr:hypothetical protein [Alkalicoccobacillus gibsonii]MBM0064987.1 hypothetical protein [Alkalicoccobacillus gibsonii]